MIIHSIIFKLGALEVFTKRDMSKNTTLPGVYWSDNLHPHGLGPFPSIYQAVEHYAIVTKQRKERMRLVNPTPGHQQVKLDPTNLPAGQLISVDFKARKRIS